jgi:biotin operon repressor
MTDFNIALGLITYSFDQALALFCKLPGEVHRYPKRAMELYSKLPDIVFSTNQLKPIIDEMKVSVRTIERYIKELKETGLVIDISNHRYKKVKK